MSDVWDFAHQLSFISLYLNERLMLFYNFEIITQNSLESAMPRQSPQAHRVFTLGEFILPSHKKM